MDPHVPADCCSQLVITSCYGLEEAGGLTIFILFISILHVLGIDSGPNHWESCNHIRGTTIPFRGSIRKPKFIPECAPEVLYSWDDLSATDHESFASDPLMGRRELYTWRTPLGTFGYGSSQLRFKLKPETKFKWIKKEDQNCIQFSEREKQSTVYVSLVGKSGISEYFFCSGAMIESWSKNAVGSRREADRELEFIKTHFDPKYQTYDAYGVFSKKRRRLLAPVGDTNLYFLPILDFGTVWTQEKLEHNLERLGQNLEPNDDQVFSRVGDEDQLAQHFIVERPSYFN